MTMEEVQKAIGKVYNDFLCVEQGEKYMAARTHVKTGNGLPLADAQALEEIARLAKKGKSPAEIASVIRVNHPKVAEEVLDAYLAFREEQQLQKLKR